MTSPCKEITPGTLLKWLRSATPCQVIDIRETHEVYDGTIEGSTVIPMADVLNSLHLLYAAAPVILCCQSGSRASAMAHVLSTDYAMNEVYSLQGGYQAWVEYTRNKAKKQP